MQTLPYMNNYPFVYLHDLNEQGVRMVT